jgi:hypothetical protein
MYVMNCIVRESIDFREEEKNLLYETQFFIHFFRCAIKCSLRLGCLIHSGFQLKNLSATSMLWSWDIVTNHVSHQHKRNEESGLDYLCPGHFISSFDLFDITIDHNRMHAADVLQGVFYFTTQAIPGFQMIPPDPDTPNAGE